ncbi:MAG: MFS transporter [Devosiaceae bacterium]|nr:MFS transporter [Devosiaceae bacterium MH13]
MSIAAAPTGELHDDTRAKKNALILALGQALGGANASIVIATGALAGGYILPAEQAALATLPVSLFIAGTAAFTLPSQRLMARLGRRPVFMGAAVLGAGAGLVAMQAVLWASFWLLCFGTFAAGMFAAVVHSYRFAAADTASPAFRPKAISWVLAGGVASGIIGPQVVIAFNDLFDPVLFAGAFLGQSGLAVASILVTSFVDLPKPSPQRAADGPAPRPISKIARQPKFRAALTSAIVAYALMALAMTAAPLAMVACGHTVGEAALGIQWHVIGMFAPSFFTGSLIARYGAPKVILAGFILLAVCAAVALSGLSVFHFWIALVLLGVGWNFGFLGATAMLTECYRPEERNSVQGWNDLILFGFVAMASFSSGGLLHLFGWDIINWLIVPIVCVASLFLLAHIRRSPETV